MKISAPDLDRVIQNALLYVNPKSPRLVEVFFVFGPEKVDVFSTDDYVVVTDSAPLVEGGTAREVCLSIEDVKKFGEWVKEDKKVVHKSEIEIKFKHTLMEVKSNDSDREVSFSFIKEPAWPAWDFLFELLSEESDPYPIEIMAVRPDRLAKLARLKADKEAPVDLRGVNIRGHLAVQFKLGETITGCIVPVDRSYVDDRFLWGETSS